MADHVSVGVEGGGIYGSQEARFVADSASAS
jgi:hypothetical protein